MVSHWSLTTIFLFFIFPKITYSYDFYICGSNGNYTSNSTYGANLNALFSSLSTNINEYGFFNASVGQGPDYLSIMMLCRADVQLEQCRICAQNATTYITRLCPNQKETFLMSSFCMLRYSNKPMFGTMETAPSIPWYYVNNVTRGSAFVTDLRTLLESLRVKAASSLHKVAGGNRTWAGDVSWVQFQTIYALVQCTPDLSSEDCSTCLHEAYQRREDCCNTSSGVYLFMPSCNLYYDDRELFFNKTRLQELDPPLLVSPGKGRNNTTRIIIIIIASVAVSLLLVTLGTFLLRKRPKERYMEKLKTDIPEHESRQYDFGEIRTATNDFSQANQLGEGGFGSVYRGVLSNDQTVAVKRLSMGSDQGTLEFKNEVIFLAGLQHRNLVRLLGFAQEGLEKVLVYEFLQSGSLDRFIYDPIKRSSMAWNTRYKIIWGVAKGLLYLHEDSRLNIIHRDIKPANVLLDEEMNPKIADFGTAKLFEPDKTQENTKKIIGTPGYMAPEYVMFAEVSDKTDVFSFGVMTLEIITGENNHISRSLISCVSEDWHNGIAANSIDPHLPSDSVLYHEILKCIHIALLCVETDATNRPTMAYVVSMLSSSNVDLPIPSNHKDCHSEVSISKVLQDTIVSDYSSTNDVMTITQFYPR